MRKPAGSGSSGLTRLEERTTSLRLDDTWITIDQRLRQAGEKWMNAIWRKGDQSR